MLRFTSFGAGTCAISGSSATIQQGASEPDWGPADPATARYVAPAPQPQPQPQQPQPQPTPAPAPARVSIVPSGPRKQRFRGTLSVGCAATVAGVCEAGATVKARGRTYRSKVARKDVAAGQRATLRITFSKAAAAGIRKALRRGAKPNATVEVRVPGAVARHAITLTR